MVCPRAATNDRSTQRYRVCVRHYSHLLPSLSSVCFPSDKRTRRRLISLSRHQFRKGKKIRRENRCCARAAVLQHRHLQPRPRPTPKGAGNVSPGANTSVCEGGPAKAAGPNHWHPPHRWKRSVATGTWGATDSSAVAAPRFRNNSSGFSDYSALPRSLLTSWSCRPPHPHRERIRLARGRSLLVLGTERLVATLRYSRHGFPWTRAWPVVSPFSGGDTETARGVGVSYYVAVGFQTRKTG